MTNQVIKNLIKNAKRNKESFTIYCKVCRMDTKIKGTPIRVKALKKEWQRQHAHAVSFKKRIVNKIKEMINL